MRARSWQGEPCDLDLSEAKELYAKEAVTAIERKPMNLYRELTPDEESEFRKWARENYVPFSDIRGIWHPVVQDECRIINESADVLPGLDDTMKELGWGTSESAKDITSESGPTTEG